MWRLFIVCAITAFSYGDAGAASESVQRLEDAGFEKTQPGSLNSIASSQEWEVQRIGCPTIMGNLIAECVADTTQARSGQQSTKLALPENTVGFEFVTIGQRLKLRGDCDYEAAISVRWPDGPEKAPTEANATSGHPSAIVSFWARHQDGAGEFAGRDVWLFDRQWKKLTFRFRATRPDQKTFVYVSLLPNQSPRQTTVYVDDFTLTERREAVVEPEKRSDLIADGEFTELKAGPRGLAKPWSFANLGGSGINGQLIQEQSEKFFQIEMSKNTTNYESAQLWQMISLEKGVRYKVSCQLRWDSYNEGDNNLIVNLGMYHEESNTWYGPIDQYLKTTEDWVTYEYTHIPPYDGEWKWYVQLNGWGNFGSSLTISVDDVSCKVSE